jgi:hypothetical protein
MCHHFFGGLIANEPAPTGTGIAASARTATQQEASTL